MILKYGVYSSESTDFSFANDGASAVLKGRMAGADIQAYLIKWLGAESSFLVYGTPEDARGSELQRGGYYDYMAFIEVSLLRVMVGQYREDWRLRTSDQEIDLTETGYIGGVKLQF